ncbi:tail assembly protein, partial [Stenotrophomonas lactitubi]
YQLVFQGGVMVLGGVAQMLAPQPKGLGAKDSAENTPNYSMNGAVNTQAQGNPVPVAYGGHDTKGMFVGSAVISGGIYAEDQQ